MSHPARDPRSGVDGQAIAAGCRHAMSLSDTAIEAVAA